MDNVGATETPIDGILWAHITFMSLAFGIIFPAGMVLGLSRSKWHIPLQILGSLLLLIGYFLGHAHGGRQFSGDNIHGSFATIVVLTLASQVSLGIYLKLHLEYGFNKWLGPLCVKIHKLIGISMPIIGYIQIVFGVITATGWCRDDHLGQCLAHFIMGSSFIAYGMMTILLLRIGSEWLRSKGKSQDYFDSLIIMMWGFMNTWTEHRWNEPWTHKDYQHTALGIMWWAGGLVGFYLSRNGKRNVFPGLVILFTGFVMSTHAQLLEVSIVVHAVFGYSLMGAGLIRIIEVCFFTNNIGSIKVIQQLPPFLLILSGRNNGEPKYDKLSNHPIPLDTQTRRTVMQDSPTSTNDYEFNSLLVHDNQFEDDDEK
ncbi:1913_t:CDS:2 [Funneliformis geosporum]|nr:1913_t:CDS:2 [Funneliformis geosporum]